MYAFFPRPIKTLKTAARQTLYIGQFSRLIHFYHVYFPHLKYYFLASRALFMNIASSRQISALTRLQINHVKVNRLPKGQCPFRITFMYLSLPCKVILILHTKVSPTFLPTPVLSGVTKIWAICLVVIHEYTLLNIWHEQQFSREKELSIPELDSDLAFRVFQARNLIF